MSFLFRKESPAPTPSPPSSQPMQISPQPGPASSPRQVPLTAADSPSTSSAAMPAFHSSHSYSSHGGGLPMHGGLRTETASQPGTPPPHESHLSRQNSTGSVGSSSGIGSSGGVSHSNPMLVTSKLSSSGSLHHIYQTNVLMTPSSSLPSTPNTHPSFLHSIPSIASELQSAAPSSSFSGAPGGAGSGSGVHAHPHATSGILTYPAPAASSASSSGVRSSPSYSPSSSPPPTNTTVHAPPALNLNLRVPTQGQDMPDSANAPADDVTLFRTMFANCGVPLARSIFQLGDTLGTGTFGRVRIVTYLPSTAAAAAAAAVAPASAASSTITATASSGPVVTPASPLITPGRPLYFALKMLKKSEIIRLKQVEHIKAEKSILSRIAHPFIVNLYASFQDERNLYMTMEFICGGELFSQLRKVGRFSNDTARFYAAEIVLAIQYLHAKGQTPAPQNATAGPGDIVYRDLKPENLLIDKEGHIKITDFGFAKVVEDRTWTLCGTPEYLAPEIIQSKGHGKAVDWWALGVLIFEMLAGYPPFYDENPFGIYQKILKGVIDFPRHMDPLAKDLIKKLLTADRTKRFGCLHAGAEDIKTHKWFSKVDWVALFNRTIKPPFVPAFRAPNDTSNFDRYPDSREGAAATQTQLNEKEKLLFADF